MKQLYTEVHHIWSDPAHGLPRIWSGNVSPLSASLCAAYMFGAAFLGAILFVRPVLVMRSAKMGTGLLMAGFLPGYLLLAPCNRLLTILFPNRWAAWIELGSLAGFCAWRFFIRQRTNLNTDVKQSIGFRFTLRKIIPLWPILALFITLVWGICCATGDATGFTFVTIFGDFHRFPAPAAKLPLFGQHYDEICFLHPILFSGLFDQYSDLLTPYWMMVGFAKVSGLLLSVLCLRRLGLRRIEAAIVASLFFLSTLSINPGADWAVFDSGHPLIIVPHPARLIGALSPLILVVAYARSRKGGGRSPKVNSLIVAGILGAGLVSISLHVFATLLLMAGLSGMFFLDKWEIARRVPLFLAPCMLAFLPLPYMQSLNYGFNHILFLVVFTAIGLYVVKRNCPSLRTNAMSGWPLLKSRVSVAASILTGAVVGLTVLGNILAPKTGLFKILGVDLLIRGVPPGTFNLGIINSKLPVPQGANVLWSASSPSHFIAAFGLPLLLAALVFLLHAIAKPNTRRQWLLICLVECMLLGFMCGLYGYHFLGGKVDFWLSVWIRSRLVEGWFYGLSAAALCALFGVVTTFQRKVLSCLVAFWAIVPWTGIFGSAMGFQWAYNLKWAIGQIMAKP